LLDKFCTALFKLTIQAKETLTLPIYKGSTLRGGFGHALRKTVCLVKDKDCPDCLLYSKCVYSYIFETPPPPDSKIMRKYPKAPHPFLIVPPMEGKRSYNADESLNFGLILIGKAIDYLPYFIFAIEELGKIGIGKNKGKFALSEVFSIDSEHKENLVYEATQRRILSLFSIRFPFQENSDHLDKERVALKFLTPVRIKYEGSLGNLLEFHVLIRNLLRRISTLTYFHCDGDDSVIDFKALIQKAKEMKIAKNNLRWYEWERYSSKQDTKMNMGGFVGEITYQGDFTEFLPWLKAGELVHVGKGTSFGLGKYEIMNN
jgi:CRISPR-associated endoribonuclease Cas6